MVSTEADMEAIDALRGSFAAAMSAEDVDGVMVNYAEDAVSNNPLPGEE